MRTFTAPLCELGEFEEITKLLKKPDAAAALTGCVDSQKLHMVYGLSDGFKYRIIEPRCAEDYGRASPDSGDYF